jgi:hypothetical protein
MTHPITPPPELVQQWRSELPTGIYDGYKYTDREKSLCVVAAQWGADQELEACCEWLEDPCTADMPSLAKDLRYSRRPKPPSLKDQALDVLHLSFDRGYLKEEAADTIRRALEQLDD